MSSSRRSFLLAHVLGAMAIVQACGPLPVGARPAPAPVHLAQQASPSPLTIAGTRYDVIIDRPQQSGKRPLLVIAPAKEYLMTGALFEQLAQAAVAEGFYTVRFNWRFVSEKTPPSADLSQEAEDLQRVLGHFRSLPAVDRARVVLAAKSFGSRAAMKTSLSGLLGLLLLTPNSSEAQPFRQTYAPLFTSPMPVHIAISEQDPYAVIPQIQAGAQAMGDRVSLHLTPHGDHNFATPDGTTVQNQAAVIATCRQWLRQRLAQGSGRV